jgi:hypothetical protein
MKDGPKYFVRNADRFYWVGEVWRVWWQRLKGPGVSVDRIRAELTAFDHFYLAVQASVALLMRWEAPELCAYEAWEWGIEIAWREIGAYELDGDIGYAFDYLRVRGFQYIIQSDGTL